MKRAVAAVVMLVAGAAHAELRRGPDFDILVPRLGEPRFAPAMRPTLSGPEKTRPTADGRCLIHWTESGDDAIADDSLADVAPHNGLPDAIDAIEDGLVSARQMYAVQLGWPEAPADAGTGGDDRLDVYVMKLDGRGFAHVRTVDPGRLDIWIELNPKSWPAAVMASVAAHELHHTMEFAVARSLDSWIYEATAVWAQYRLRSSYELGLARDVLWAFRLKNPERSLFAAEGQLHYAAFVWWKFLVDYLSPAGAPDDDLVRRAWLAMAAAGSVQGGLDSFLAATPAGSLAGGFDRMVEWMWFACAEDDNYHWREDLLRCKSSGPLGERAQAAVAVQYPASGRLERLEPLGAGYLQLQPDCKSGDAHITITADAGGLLGVRLLEIPPLGSATVVTARQIAGGSTTSFDVPAWNGRRRVVVALANLDAPPAAVRGVSYSVTVTGSYAPPASERPIASLTPRVQTLELAVGARAQPAVSVGYGGTCEDGTRETADVEWLSDDPRVVRGDSGGLLAVAPGLVAVRARIGVVTSSELYVTVTPAGSDDGGCRVGGGRGHGQAVAWLLAALLVLLIRARSARGTRPPRAPSG